MTAPNDKRGDPPQPRRPLAALDPQHPWPGLESFQEGDAGFFSGRDREADELHRLVHRQRLTLLYGVSGSGKTSLLRAGLFPHLRRDGLFPIYLRLDHGADAPTLTEQVSAELHRQARLYGVELPPPEGDSLWEMFHRTDFELWSDRNRLLFPLLVLDQFEELFTLGRQSPEDRRHTAAVLGELADLVEGRPPETLAEELEEEPERARALTFGEHRYKVLFAFREEFLPEVDALRDEMPSSIHNRYRLTPMTGDAALEAVIGPGEGVVTPEVAEHIVRFVAAEEDREESQEKDAREPLAALEVEPALLSLVCRELNRRRLDKGRERITPELLDTGRKEILTRFYEDSLLGMAPEVRHLVEEELLTVSGYRDSLAWDNALETPGVTEATLRELVDRRLLRIEETPRGRRVELVHDRLTGVVGESRDRRHREEKLEEARRRERQELLRREKEAERARQTRELARTRRFLFVLSALAALVVVFAMVAWRQGWQAQRARRVAEKAVVRSANLLIESGRTGEGAAYLAQALEQDPTNTPARARLFDLLLRRRWPLLRALQTLEQPAFYVTWSPRGDLLAVHSASPTLELRDPQTGELVVELPHETRIWSTAFSPDGRLLVTASLDGSARLWSTTDGTRVGAILRHPGFPRTARFSPDGRRLATASSLGMARVWDATTGQPIGPPLEHDASGNRAGVLSLEIGPEGRRLITSDDQGWVYLWDATTGSPLAEPWLHRQAASQVFAAEISPDGERLLTASRELARLWDARTRQSLGLPMQQEDPLAGAHFSPRGERVLTFSTEGSAQLWDAETGEPIGGPLRHRGSIREAHFSPDGRLALTVSTDGTARLWDAATGLPFGEAMRHGAAVDSGAFSPAGDRIATTARDSTLRLWELPTSAATNRVLAHGDKVWAVSFRPDGAQVVTAGDDASAKLWNVETGEREGPPLLHQQLVSTASYHPDGRRLLTGSVDGTAKIWDLESHEVLVSLPHDGNVRSAELDPEGRRVLTVAGAAAYLWVADTGELTATLRHAGPVHSAHFSPDGRQVVTASRDETARVWSVQTGEPIGAPLEHGGAVLWAELGPGGRRVATASVDGTARLWDAVSREPVGEPLLHSAAVQTVRFHPDGHSVVTASLDGKARLWDADTGEAIGEPMRHPEDVYSARFGPGGLRVVTTSFDDTAQLWDAGTGQSLGDPLRHDALVWDATFDRTGRRVATASWDGTARLWDIPVGTESDSIPLADLAEAVVGLRINERGAAVPVDRPDRDIQRLRDEAARKAPAGGWNVWDFIRWFLSDPETRPWSSYIPLPGDEDGPAVSTSDAAASEARSEASTPVSARASPSDSTVPSDSAS